MKLTVTESVWLNDAGTCSIDHLAEVSGLSLEEVADLVQSGILDAADESAQAFHLHHVVTVRRARRLRDDFQLDRNGLALALVLLRRIEELEQALKGK
ncbi:chaperone modulatory protein CbpM [Noviherbaspirillum humi]|uniref:Chaperone modulatory protein CbpM n=1 Tax=Noviherbaspirillum humi TaxID=1688639 RepID=A0A239E845_9BURK|nr:chaperone modulator CbpM [Noviherbaspirillum humi]SNS40163.1 chaperone modulatory protein CbpM [Noviherbaspirillum humi]